MDDLLTKVSESNPPETSLDESSRQRLLAEVYTSNRWLFESILRKMIHPNGFFRDSQDVTETIEDVIQSAYVALHQYDAVKKYGTDPNVLRRIMCQTVRNQAINEFRKRQRMGFQISITEEPLEDYHNGDLAMQVSCEPESISNLKNFNIY